MIAFTYRLHIGAGLAALEGLRLALSVLSSHVCPPFKKVSLKFKKVKGAKKYQVQFSKSKKFKKIILKKTVKKTKLTIKKTVLRNKSKLYVRVKAVGSNKWSKPKKVKIKK